MTLECQPQSPFFDPRALQELYIANGGPRPLTHAENKILQAHNRGESITFQYPIDMSRYTRQVTPSIKVIKKAKRAERSALTSSRVGDVQREAPSQLTTNEMEIDIPRYTATARSGGEIRRPLTPEDSGSEMEIDNQMEIEHSVLAASSGKERIRQLTPESMKPTSDQPKIGSPGWVSGLRILGYISMDLEDEDLMDRERKIRMAKRARKEDANRQLMVTNAQKVTSE